MFKVFLYSFPIFSNLSYLSDTDLILSDLDGFWFLFNVFLYSFPILSHFSYLSGTDFILFRWIYCLRLSGTDFIWFRWILIPSIWPPAFGPILADSSFPSHLDRFLLILRFSYRDPPRSLSPNPQDPRVTFFAQFSMLQTKPQFINVFETKNLARRLPSWI